MLESRELVIGEQGAWVAMHGHVATQLHEDEVTPGDDGADELVRVAVRRERTAHDEVVFFEAGLPDRALGHSPLHDPQVQRYNTASTTHHTGTTSTTERPAAVTRRSSAPDLMSVAS